MRQGNDSTNRPTRQPGWQQVLGLPELPIVQGYPPSVIEHPPLSGTSFKAAIALTAGDALSITILTNSGHSYARKRNLGRNARIFGEPPRSGAGGCQPPKATTRPYTRHILGIDSGVQSHPKATPKPPQSLLIGNRLGTQSHPKATSMRPQSHHKATTKRHQSHLKATR